jgi:hypothetical protein
VRLATALGVLLLLSPVVAYGLWRGTYYWEKDDVERGLKAIPGVTVEKVWGNEDLTLEKIGAVIQVQGKGPLRLLNLHRDSLVATESLQLSQVGRWHVNLCGEQMQTSHSMADGSEHRQKGRFWGGSIPMGPGSPYAPLLPVHFTNVQTVVEHYDELLASVEQWPRLPERATLVMPDGLRVRYGRSDKEWDYRSCPEMFADRP